MKVGNSLIVLSLLLLVGFGKYKREDRTQFFPKVEQKPERLPRYENSWVFILAGQSNMAGRGKVEPADTLPHPRILTINPSGDLILAKEPIHFYEPTLSGLDCGLSFGRELLRHIPDSISIVLIPTAVGGSSIDKWINDSTFRKVPLLSNFKEKVRIGKKYGSVKGILWHQGESDSPRLETIQIYDIQLRRLFRLFREEIGALTLPIFLGELGSYSKSNENWQAINAKINEYIRTDPHSSFVSTNDLHHNGDGVHFDSEGQRELGKRYARAFVESVK